MAPWSVAAHAPLAAQVIRYEARDRGKGVNAEQSDLSAVIRRGTGTVNLFTMCILYAELASRMGVELDVVLFAPPQMLRGRGPEFLLRLANPNPGEPQLAQQEEVYVDLQVLAHPHCSRPAATTATSPHRRFASRPQPRPL